MNRIPLVAALFAAVCFAAAAHVAVAAITAKPHLPSMPNVVRLIGAPQHVTAERIGRFELRCFWWNVSQGFVKECFVVGVAKQPVVPPRKRPSVPGA